jgi:predicted transcriptional regulator of viral defense system
MGGKHYQTVYDLAEAQHGYFSIGQAADVGVPADRIRDMDRRGTLERVSRGVYRLANFPLSPRGQYLEAVLWPASRAGSAPGVLSHESALAFYDLSDVNPAKLHITIEARRRLWREPPPHLVVHRGDLPNADVRYEDGVPVTAVTRTIRDCARSHLGPALVRQAINDGRRTGRLRADEAEALTTELSDAGLL